MLSIRAAARAAPRTASRFASRTSSIKPAFNIISRTTQQAPRVAAFSTSRWRLDENAQHLAVKLDSEIKIETEESASQATSDTHVESFLAENPGWTIEDTPGDQDVFLKRKFEDETVTVHFSIADFNQEMEAEDDMDAAMADEEDMDMQSHGGNTKGAINQGLTGNRNFKIAPEDSIAPADREELQDEEDSGNSSYNVYVDVLVQRSGKGALKFDLVAVDGDIIINQLTHVAESASKNAAEILRKPSETAYAGPPFQQLDEEVQGIIESYLDARGINSALAQFLPEYIDVKEQKEYLGWLNRVKEFVE